jgi:hypothetical protein
MRQVYNYPLKGEGRVRVGAKSQRSLTSVLSLHQGRGESVRAVCAVDLQTLSGFG